MQLQKENLGKVAITIEEDYWDINKDRSEFGLKVGFGFYF